MDRSVFTGSGGEDLGPGAYIEIENTIMKDVIDTLKKKEAKEINVPSVNCYSGTIDLEDRKFISPGPGSY